MRSNMSNMDASLAKSLNISGSYVSCLKINGVPLLPPLMTQEYREEMQYYRKLAVAVEQRMSDLRSILDWQSQTDDEAVKVHPLDEDLITFIDDNERYTIPQEIEIPEKDCSNLKSVSTETIVLDKSELTTPKLVRQNSYILESPGPLLQAHLQVQSASSGIDVSAISMSESKIIKQHSNFEPKVAWPSTSEIATLTENSPEKLVSASPMNTNDDHMQRIHLQKILHEMQKTFMQKMSQLIVKQKEEQQSMHESFEEQRRLLLKKLPGVPRNLLLSFEDRQLLNTPESIISSNTMDDVNNYTLNSDDNQSWNASPRNSELQCTVIDTKAETSAKNNSFELSEVLEKNCSVSIKNEAFSNGPFSEERQKEGVFPETKETEAATVIAAYMRGFLVRRLLKTERVQNIVHTLRDALVCALELHRDSSGIHGADVDLHRRLIQQITSACYTLHETFFTISIKERMEIIAQDRERLQLLVLKKTFTTQHNPLMRKPSPIMTRSLPSPRKFDMHSEAKRRHRLARFVTSNRNLSDECKVIETLLPHGKRLRCVTASPGTKTN